MNHLDQAKDAMHAEPRVWLITGVAGFIGSNLLEALLTLGQTVIGLDNFATGSQANLDDVRMNVGEAWDRFSFVDGDISSSETCRAACEGVDIVLHEAALGSVPRSLRDPLASHMANVDGFLNMCLAARDANVSRVVYASSSSVYGDDALLPKVESRLGRPMSPYAVTKLTNELYAGIFADAYKLPVVGLRYFNVFGRRQDPDGAYAAVIPRWIAAQLRGEQCTIYGDGESSRDFCYVENVVEANLLAATAPTSVVNEVFNVAVGHRTTLNQLHELIGRQVEVVTGRHDSPQPRHAPSRPGDIAHSEADVSKAATLLGYSATYTIEDGLADTIGWYAAKLVSAS